MNKLTSKNLAFADLTGHKIAEITVTKDGYIRIMTDIGVGIESLAKVTYGCSETDTEPFVGEWLYEWEEHPSNNLSLPPVYPPDAAVVVKPDFVDESDETEFYHHPNGDHHHAELHNVGSSDDRVAYGHIYNDKKKRFPDGMSIRTSLILDRYEVEGKRYIKTMNTVYLLV